jgi:hypothetical protein
MCLANSANEMYPSRLSSNLSWRDAVSGGGGGGGGGGARTHENALLHVLGHAQRVARHLD